MDDDDLTKQRALDAAAAVAVAAAAAAQQTREAANAAAAEVQYRHGEESSQQQQEQQQQNQQQQSGDGVVVKENDDSSMTDVNGFTQHMDQGEEELQQDESGTGVSVARKFDESTDDVGDSFVASTSVSDQREGDDEAVTSADGKMKRTKKPTVHHTKRRKINTCIPCKRRKVKCDREKPYCGQCKRHNFPPSECTWSAFAADIPPAKIMETSTIVAPNPGSAPTSSGLQEPAAVSESGGSNTTSQWLDMSSAPWASFTSISAEQTIQTLQNRVAELEAALEALRNEKNNGAPAEQEVPSG